MVNLCNVLNEALSMTSPTYLSLCLWDLRDQVVGMHWTGYARTRRFTTARGYKANLDQGDFQPPSRCMRSMQDVGQV